jgi:hypothetical protein
MRGTTVHGSLYFGFLKGVTVFWNKSYIRNELQKKAWSSLKWLNRVLKTDDQPNRRKEGRIEAHFSPIN